MKSLSLTQPHIIAIIGIPGSGKTQFASQFSQTFHAPYVNLESFLPHVSEKKSAEALANLCLEQFLKTGASVLVEGLGATRTERMELTKKARQAGYKPLFVWVQIDQPTASSRCTKPAKNSSYQPISQDEFEERVKRFTAPSAVEKPVVISGKHTYASQAKVILKHLSAPRADRAPQPLPRPAGPRHRGNVIIR